MMLRVGRRYFSSIAAETGHVFRKTKPYGVSSHPSILTDAGSTSGKRPLHPVFSGSPHSVDVIAHRGASGHLPAHSLASYDEACRAGADWIELDVQVTQDEQLVVCHDMELSLCTNILQSHPKWTRTRYSEKLMPCSDGESELVCGYLVDSFALEEIQELRLTMSEGRSMAHLMSQEYSPHGVPNVHDVNRHRLPSLLEAAQFIQRKRDHISQGDSLTEGSRLSKHMRSMRLGHQVAKEHGYVKVPYTKKIGRMLEDAYQVTTRPGQAKRVYLDIYQRRYLVDFESMKQRNLDTNYERSIYRDQVGDRIVWSWRRDESPSIGLYVEIKRPSYFFTQGFNIEEKVVEDIEKSGFDGPVVVESFELGSLRRMRRIKPEWPLVKLTVENEIPIPDPTDYYRAVVDSVGWDGNIDGEEPMRVSLSSREDPVLRQLKAWIRALRKDVDGVGCDKTSLIPDPSRCPIVSPLVEEAHDSGLAVVPYTFRSDSTFLHRAYGGNASYEFIKFFQLGIDSLFADFPDHCIFARSLWERLVHDIDGSKVGRGSKASLFSSHIARAKYADAVNGAKDASGILFADRMLYGQDELDCVKLAEMQDKLDSVDHSDAEE